MFIENHAATTSSATIVNQVQRGFNGLGQIASEAQGHTSAGAGSAPTVTYAYTEMSKGANHSRLTTLTYPTDLSPDSTLTFNYSGGDDSMSRLSSISDGTDTLESYSYLGLGTVVKRVHPQPDLITIILTTIRGRCPCEPTDFRQSAVATIRVCKSDMEAVLLFLGRGSCFGSPLQRSRSLV